MDYAGLDGVTRRTSLSFDPAPSHLDRGIGTYALELPSGKRMSIFLAIECNAVDTAPRPKRFLRGMHAAFRERKVAAQGATTIRTSNELFNRVLIRSLIASQFPEWRCILRTPLRSGTLLRAAAAIMAGGG
jgi:hypothetical protein